MKLGKDLVLAIGGTPLAACRSCNIDKQQSFIPTASPTSGRWEQSTPERLAWSISADALLGTMAAYKTLDAAQDNGTPLTIRYYDTEYNLNKTGVAYIESLRLEGSVGSLMRMSVTLKGSGPLSTYGGTPVDLNEVYTEQDIYYSNRGGSYGPSSSSGATIECYTLSLAQRTQLKFIPNGNTIFWSDSSSLIPAVEDHEMIYGGQEYDYALEELTEMWVAAGTYYIVFSYPPDTENRPQILSLS